MFYWPSDKPPDVNAVNVTDLVAIVGGPYKTQAEAEKAAGKDPHATVKGVPTSRPGSSSGNLPNPLAALGTFEAFFKVITDVTLWRSLAWIAIGAWMIMTGIGLWLGIPQTLLRVAGSAGRGAV